ncbi:MAG: biopolymer transporter ExbD [Candidatus Latescibacteria bacterium]|jgi:biopolymer transport protein ExbD|nr:biopolymer transporter ExbD [Candidatus Latescibacterota bacterium]
MAKGKKSHPPVFLDMTPMVDIAFLLLIFFMATTQFKEPESIPILLPDSHSVIELPQSDVLIITVGKKPENQIFWRLEPQPEVAIRVPEMKKAVIEARVRNPKLRIAIKGDREAEFGIISDIMDIMQETNNTRFNLITNFEDDPKSAPDGEARGPVGDNEFARR